MDAIGLVIIVVWDSYSGKVLGIIKDVVVFGSITKLSRTV